LSVAAADIEAALRAALAPTALEIQDDSHLHVGHAGAREAVISASASPARVSKAWRRLPATASYMMPCTP